MPSKKKKYNARFPAGRIKKIMQTDEEVGKVAQAVPIIISRTLELFVKSLLQKAMQITNAKNAKTLTTSHMKQCILSESRFDFLKELVANIPDISTADDSIDVVNSEIDPNINISEPVNSSIPSFQQNQIVKSETMVEIKSEISHTPNAAIDLSVKSNNPSSEQVITPNFYKEIYSPIEYSVASPSVIQYSPKVKETKSIKHSVANIINKPSHAPKPSKVPRLSTVSSVGSKKPQIDIGTTSPVYSIDLHQSPKANITPNVNISSTGSRDAPVLHFDFSNAAFGKTLPPLIPITNSSATPVNIVHFNSPVKISAAVNSLSTNVSQNLDEDYDT